MNLPGFTASSTLNKRLFYRGGYKESQQEQIVILQRAMCDDAVKDCLREGYSNCNYMYGDECRREQRCEPLQNCRENVYHNCRDRYCGTHPGPWV